MSTLDEAILADAGPDPAVRIGIDELCDRYAARVYRFAALLSRSGPDAEDLAQSALERAIRALPRTELRTESVEGWLWRIVVNTARDAGRAAKRRQLLLERLLAHGPPETTALDIEDAIGDEELLHAVRNLSRRQRTLVALRFGADLDYARIAAMLGISPGAARLATRRALLALRARLEVRQ
ncbi:MAG TPA: sigma-70 family RNA polymerase sigma factor [Candidatus Dormibacteraeota bacterium]|nr:sigma-70 family RNA polymerase sigma factor [Candidatus Dormibacteraeota bacterium]